MWTPTGAKPSPELVDISASLIVSCFLVLVGEIPLLQW